MCGIAGSINFPLNIPKLTSDLFHRGPDEQTTYTDENVILHHHRLSILDIAGGKQPMHYEHLTIIFNGEIYNHQELRRKFNLTCKTNSDTETILHLYAKMGAGFLNEMDGMFVFIIHDKKEKQLFIARDRAGKKPVYYYTNNSEFVFASELHAIKNQVSLQVDDDAVSQFINKGYLYKSSTPYKNVFELPAAGFMYISAVTGSVQQINQWWRIEDYYRKKSTDSLDVAINNVDLILNEAVKNRVESSDLEVGSFLSGGIDSGLVTAIAKKYNSSLKTFTVSFEGEYNEAPLAKLVANRYQTQHHEIKISYDNLSNDIEKILASYGEPHFDDSAIPSYYVSREAKKSLTVILNGDGGDEIFGGYRRYIPFSKIDFFKQPGFAKSLFKLLHTAMPDTKSKMNKLNYFKRLFFLGSGNSGIDTYLRSTTDIFQGFEKYIKGGNLADEKLLQNDFEKIINSDFTGLQKIMMLDFENILPSVLLVKMDIATMQHSLEGRSPLLSKGIVEYVPSLSDSMKIKGTTTKYLLRKLAEKYLPEELINQPKRGFEVPLQKWVNSDLTKIIGDYLVDPNAFYTSYIDKNFILQLLDGKIKMAPEKRAKILWLVFTLEVWYKKIYKA